MSRGRAEIFLRINSNDLVQVCALNGARQGSEKKFFALKNIEIPMLEQRRKPEMRGQKLDSYAQFAIIIFAQCILI